MFINFYFILLFIWILDVTVDFVHISHMKIINEIELLWKRTKNQTKKNSAVFNVMRGLGPTAHRITLNISWKRCIMLSVVTDVISSSHYPCACACAQVKWLTLYWYSLANTNFTSIIVWVFVRAYVSLYALYLFYVRIYVCIYIY